MKNKMVVMILGARQTLLGFSLLRQTRVPEGCKTEVKMFFLCLDHWMGSAGYIRDILFSIGPTVMSLRAQHDDIILVSYPWNFQNKKQEHTDPYMWSTQLFLKAIDNVWVDMPLFWFAASENWNSVETHGIGVDSWQNHIWWYPWGWVSESKM